MLFSHVGVLFVLLLFLCVVTIARSKRGSRRTGDEKMMGNINLGTCLMLLDARVLDEELMFPEYEYHNLKTYSYNHINQSY